MRPTTRIFTCCCPVPCARDQCVPFAHEAAFSGHAGVHVELNSHARGGRSGVDAVGSVLKAALGKAHRADPDVVEPVDELEALLKHGFCDVCRAEPFRSGGDRRLRDRDGSVARTHQP